MHATPRPHAATANWPQGPFVCAECRRPIYGNAYACLAYLERDAVSLRWCSEGCWAAWNAARASTDGGPVT